MINVFDDLKWNIGEWVYTWDQDLAKTDLRERDVYPYVKAHKNMRSPPHGHDISESSASASLLKTHIGVEPMSIKSWCPNEKFMVVLESPILTREEIIDEIKKEREIRGFLGTKRKEKYLEPVYQSVDVPLEEVLASTDTPKEPTQALLFGLPFTNSWRGNASYECSYVWLSSFISESKIIYRVSPS